MSEENIEVVWAMLEAFNRDDVDHVVAAFTNDCELYEPPEMPDRLATGYQGHEGIREWAGNLRGIANVRFEAHDLGGAGDVIVSEWVGRVVGRPATCRFNGPRSSCSRCAGERSRVRTPSSPCPKPSKPLGGRSRRCRRRTSRSCGRPGSRSREGTRKATARLVDPEVEFHGTVGGLQEGEVAHG